MYVLQLCVILVLGFFFIVDRQQRPGTGVNRISPKLEETSSKHQFHVFTFDSFLSGSAHKFHKLHLDETKIMVLVFCVEGDEKTRFHSSILKLTFRYFVRYYYHLTPSLTKSLIALAKNCKHVNIPIISVIMRYSFINFVPIW